MRGYALIIVFLLSCTTVLALTGPVTHNGKEYYVVTATDLSEDTGAEVCAKVGKFCVGYTEPTDAVCKKFHTNARSSSSVSGDKSGVFCNGAPQNGVCSTQQNTCHTCPTCSRSVDCGTPISGLYREMFVECANPQVSSQCRVYVNARTTQDFLQEIPNLNNQLRVCPLQLPAGSGIAISNGDSVVDVRMNNGGTESFTATLQNGQLTGIRRGSSQCRQRFTITENDLNNVLGSSNRGQAAQWAFANKRFSVSGCTIWQSIRTGFVSPIGRFFVQRQAPPQPPPPRPNCGQVGEQCNNRGCVSGMCGAPREQNNGQWGHWNYQCLNQQQYTANCIGRGNTPPAWQCSAYPCR